MNHQRLPTATARVVTGVSEQLRTDLFSHGRRLDEQPGELDALLAQAFKTVETQNLTLGLCKANPPLADRVLINRKLPGATLHEVVIVAPVRLGAQGQITQIRAISRAGLSYMH